MRYQAALRPDGRFSEWDTRWWSGRQGPEGRRHGRQLAGTCPARPVAQLDLPFTFTLRHHNFNDFNAGHSAKAVAMSRGRRETRGMAYFFFGTLRDRDVLEVVVGRGVSDGDVKAAEISGYRLVRVVDESYPALVGDADGRVEGVLVSGLKATEVERLAWFEGKEYMPKAVDARLTESGEGMAASIQVPTQHLETTDDDWEFQRWQRSEKERLISLTRGHMALFGNCSLDEAIDVWDAAREELEARSAATTRR